MPRKPRIPTTALPTIAPELLASFGNGPKTAEVINAASLAFKKALIERALAGEIGQGQISPMFRWACRLECQRLLRAFGYPRTTALAFTAASNNFELAIAVLEPEYRWSLQDIDTQPIAGSEWVSPASGETYYTKYRIILSGEQPADLTRCATSPAVQGGEG